MKIGCWEVPKPSYPPLLWPAEWKAPAPLMPTTYPIASLNGYTPNFSGVPQKLTWCHWFGLQQPPKSAYPKSWKNIGSVAACTSVVGNCATHLTLFGGIIYWTWDCKLYKRIHCKGHLVGNTFSKSYFTLWLQVLWLVRLCNCIIQHSASAVPRYQHLCALSCYLMIPPCHSVQPDGFHCSTDDDDDVMIRVWWRRWWRW